ncbi:hypothetical protein EE076_29480, partial [Klebsiella pneumoniae]|nr:hypothetical protein [Klebsiella pneumoniae]NAU49703.1 hypothetical protein [Klebsiella pneumoniae]NAU95231.1 hypothetical protein [Klebsiella pneumoniae]
RCYNIQFAFCDELKAYVTGFVRSGNTYTANGAAEMIKEIVAKEGANKQVISSQADSLIKISRIWADFFPANTSNQPI